MSKPDAILLAGPTASGKSGLAMALAERMDGIVINADSMQVYGDLCVLTARPDDVDLARVPHRLYGHISGSKQYTTARWLAEVKQEIQAVQNEARVPIIVGGTGLYFTSLLSGLSDMPAVKNLVREEVRTLIHEKGSAHAHDVLMAEDRAAANMLKPSDAQRIARALEIKRSSGRSITAYPRPDLDSLPLAGQSLAKIILEPARADLHARIASRFAQMVELGALAEAKSLLDKNLPADRTILKAIGVPQFTKHVLGEITLDEVIEKSVIATRQYAKRQSTWFRNQFSDDWLRFENPDQARTAI